MMNPESNLPPQAQSPFAERFAWRPILARRLLRTLFVIIVLAVIAASYYAIAEGDYLYIPIYAVLFGGMAIITFWNRVTDDARIIGIMTLLYLVALLDYVTEGRGSLAPLLLTAFAFAGALFFGRRGIIAALAVSILTMAGFAYAYTTGLLPDYLVSSKVLPGWVSNAMIIVFVISFISFSVNFVISELTNLMKTDHELSRALEAERLSLEKTIAERTSTAEAARAEAEAARQEVEAQMWQAMGQAQLAERMRGEQSIVALANRLISFLCQYLQAQAGLLYVVEGEKLSLAGGYAFTEHPGFKETLQFGEGLVGQAARQGESILIDEIPADMMMITSGLGSTPPNQVLIMPLSVDSRVVGVVELATLTKFSIPQQIFLSRNNEDIAIGLMVAQTRQQITNLLSDTQRQAEELHTREEELRAINEELQAQAEHVKPHRPASAKK